MAYVYLFLVFAIVQGQKSLNPNRKCGITAASFLDTRVVGGYKITADDAPWAVVIEKKRRENPDQIVNSCGGNIISPKVIVSAAHCFSSYRKPEKYNVYVGVSSLSPKTEKALQIKRIYLHPGWQQGGLNRTHRLNLGHDIALLELEEELESVSYTHLTLPTICSV